jgi:hypothetical protein
MRIDYMLKNGLRIPGAVDVFSLREIEHQLDYPVRPGVSEEGII